MYAASHGAKYSRETGWHRGHHGAGAILDSSQHAAVGGLVHAWRMLGRQSHRTVLQLMGAVGAAATEV